MSGGYWNYSQHHMLYMVETLDSVILNNSSDKKDEFGDQVGRHYSPETIAEFKNALKSLRIAYVYAQRIDWLLSGDDGEDNFHTRLQKQLKELT